MNHAVLGYVRWESICAGCVALAFCVHGKMFSGGAHRLDSLAVHTGLGFLVLLTGFGFLLVRAGLYFLEARMGICFLEVHIVHIGPDFLEAHWIFWKRTQVWVFWW